MIRGNEVTRLKQAPLMALESIVDIGEHGLPAALPVPNIEPPMCSVVVTQRLQHLVFVVAAEKDPMRIPGLPGHDLLNNLSAVRATIDVVAKKDHAISLRLDWK